MKSVSNTLKRIAISGVMITVLAMCGSESDSGITMYASAKSGLIIRSQAATNSKKLGLVPYGDNLTVIKQDGEQSTIAGRTGRWSKIDYQGTIGWVFGGFLSANPPQKLVQKNKCDPFMKCYGKCVDLMAGPGYETCMDDCDSGWLKLQKACDPNIGRE